MGDVTWFGVAGVVAVVALVSLALAWLEHRMGRPGVDVGALLEECAGGASGEVDAQLRTLGPAFAALCEDDYRKLTREFGAVVHDLYWDRVTVDEFRRVCASLLREAECLRAWF